MRKEARIHQRTPQLAKPVERSHWPQIGSIVEYVNDFGQARAICIEGNHSGYQLRLGELVPTDGAENPTIFRSSRALSFTPQGARVAYHLLKEANFDQEVPGWKAEHGHSRVVIRRESFQGSDGEVSGFRFAQEHPHKKGEKPYVGAQVSGQELDLIRGLLERHVLPHIPQSPAES